MHDANIARLRQRYVACFGEEPAPVGAIAALESSLDVELPRDLREIAEFYSGGLLGGVSHNAFVVGAAENIVEETIRLRAVAVLPHRYLVLAEPAESLIVLDTASGAVVWCDNFDAARLNNVNTMLGAPDLWPSYAAFFEHLLDEEAAERAERHES